MSLPLVCAVRSPAESRVVIHLWRALPWQDPDQAIPGEPGGVRWGSASAPHRKKSQRTDPVKLTARDSLQRSYFRNNDIVRHTGSGQSRPRDIGTLLDTIPSL